MPRQPAAEPFLTTEDGEPLEIVEDHEVPPPYDEIRGTHDYE
jgi:hypothetical protein